MIEIDSKHEDQDEVGVTLDENTGLVTVRNYETVLVLTPDEADTLVDKLSRARGLHLARLLYTRHRVISTPTPTER